MLYFSILSNDNAVKDSIIKNNIIPPIPFHLDSFMYMISATNITGIISDNIVHPISFTPFIMVNFPEICIINNTITGNITEIIAIT